jgi:hypothetical protein
LQLTILEFILNRSQPARTLTSLFLYVDYEADTVEFAR